MCGIVGYIGNKKATPILINGLLSLEYRGYDSAGIAVLENNKIVVMKDKGRVNNLNNIDGINNLNGTIGIAHTRWATHGKPSKENSHPHLDNSNSFAVVHNGIIENYNELRNFLTEKGYTNRVIVVRKDSPLVIGKGENENYIASDIPAILSHTKNFYLLDDNEYAEIYTDHINFYDSSLVAHSKAVKNIEWDASAAEKDGFEDYMLKEIFEQPNSIRETIG